MFKVQENQIRIPNSSMLGQRWFDIEYALHELTHQFMATKIDMINRHKRTKSRACSVDSRVTEAFLMKRIEEIQTEADTGAMFSSLPVFTKLRPLFQVGIVLFLRRMAPACKNYVTDAPGDVVSTSIEPLILQAMKRAFIGVADGLRGFSKHCDPLGNRIGLQQSILVSLEYQY